MVHQLIKTVRMYIYYRSRQKYKHVPTVEPVNNGHFGTSNFWHKFTVIERLCFSKRKVALPWYCTMGIL